MPGAQILQLQRLIGNRATTRIIQRMPSRNRVVERLGKPKMNFGIGPLKKENSTKYKAVLDTLDSFHSYITAELHATQPEVMAQLKQLMREFDAIIAATSAYDAEDEDGDKKEYMLELKLQAQNEKTACIGPMVRASENPNRFLVNGKRSNLGNFLGVTDALVMNEANNRGTVGGGMNTLNVYGPAGANQPSESKTYFKQNMESMNPSTFEEESAMAEQIRTMPGGPARAALEKELTVRQNQADFSEKGGISATDTRSSNREVASYRLDQLLDAGLIARTQFALRKVGNQSILGTSQRGASGKAAGDLKPTTDVNDRANVGQDAFSTDDPNLLRLLSRLQLLDNLAMQLDRHTGNYYLKLDANGNVIGLTGIDNDMSFGTNTNLTQRKQKYSGLSLYVDKNMAQKIIALDPELLALVMSDLLDPNEMAALITRLTALKVHLNAKLAAGELMDPADWDVVVAQDMNQEGGTDRGTNYAYTLDDKGRSGARGY